MKNIKNIIGQSIICSAAGIGEIVDVASLHEGGEKFYKVTFPKDKCINYFSLVNNGNYRILASKKTLQEAVKVFKSRFKKVEYTTTQEKISTQKEMLREENIVKLAKTLSILNNEKEIHAHVRKPFKDSLESFIAEIVFVFKITKVEAHLKLGLKASGKVANK